MTGATARWLTDDCVEMVTPSATYALSQRRRVALTGKSPRAAAKESAVVEFLAGNVHGLLTRLRAEFGGDLVSVQPPTRCLGVISRFCSATPTVL